MVSFTSLTEPLTSIEIEHESSIVLIAYNMFTQDPDENIIRTNLVNDQNQLMTKNIC